jgi:hypothetical protein
VKHRHEVRLARTEAAVQVTRLAVRRFDRRADEAEGVVEGVGQLRRDDVLIERLISQTLARSVFDESPPVLVLRKLLP